MTFPRIDKLVKALEIKHECWRGMDTWDGCDYYETGMCITDKNHPKDGLIGLCELKKEIEEILEKRKYGEC